MAIERLLVITGDHTLTDPTKFSGGYTEDDLRLHGVMVDALESLGRWTVDVCTDHAELMARLAGERPDLVVNFCDTGFGNVATRELHLPALCELHGIPYTGATPAAMVLAYDKALVNLLGQSLGVPVPFEVVVSPGGPLPAVELPALVKPARGDGSVGINRHAVVETREQLARQLEWLAGAVGGPALVQEYLPGPEYGLALIGNPGSLRALPPLEVDYSKLSDEVPPILAFESKTGPSNPYDEVAIKPAELDATTTATLVEHGSRMFERIGCRDYARFDFRTSSSGKIALMEVNPNPAWSCEAKLARMARFEGLAYPQLLELLVDTAIARTA